MVTPQDFQILFDHFSAFCMKELTNFICTCLLYIELLGLNFSWTAIGFHSFETFVAITELFET